MTTKTPQSSGDAVYVTEALIAEDIDAYLDQHQHKTMLRFITCGSVDDGKSTLIGRLLYDSKMIFEDRFYNRLFCNTGDPSQPKLYTACGPLAGRNSEFYKGFSP